MPTVFFSLFQYGRHTVGDETYDLYPEAIPTLYNNDKLQEPVIHHMVQIEDNKNGKRVHQPIVA